MDLTDAAGTKAVDADSDAPGTRIQPPTSNGFLKRHQSYGAVPYARHQLSGSAAAAAAAYKDCLKNHAASLGGYAVDGCGEFMPSPTATPADPTSFRCAACGCHRNFHRREPEEPLAAAAAIPLLEFQPHHRHHPPPPPPTRGRSPDSQSPPPISSSFYPAAPPHVLLALSTGLPAHSSQAINATPTSAALPSPTPNPNGRKRHRTKFSPAQKEKMHRFAEQVGWKLQKKDEHLVAQVCSDAGVDRGVLKVWMHNNKNTAGRRRDFNHSAAATDPDAHSGGGSTAHHRDFGGDEDES